jgi:DNA-damage-inducible protein D
VAPFEHQEVNVSDQDSTGLSLEAFDEQASERIRHVMYKGEPYYSVIDVVGFLTESASPRRYWTDMKRRLADEGFAEVYAKCVQLAMPAPDGKQRQTDAANGETIFRIIESIPSSKAEPFKQWLAKTGHERLEETADPQKVADRMRRQYRALGYSDEWIRARLQGIVVRDQLTEEWRERGAKDREFALLTDILSRGTFELTTAEHKALKQLKARHNLRDSMTPVELALTILSEATATELHQERDSQGIEELKQDAGEAGEVGGAARHDIEQRLGRPVVSGENYKRLRQGRQRDLQDPLFPGEPGGKGE